VDEIAATAWHPSRQQKLLLATAALTALSFGGSAVQAADMPVKAVAPVPVHTWSGCYVGVQVGYKWGKSEHTSTGFNNGVANGTAGDNITPWFNANGALGGAEGGCQYQWGNWVWGVEVDGSWVAAEGQSNDIPPFATTFLSKTSERWQAMARGRIGYAWDKWLWYVTGGGTWAGIDITSFSPTVPTAAATERHSRGGWVVGYGTEYDLGHGWSVKGESLYTDYGTFRALSSTVSGCCTERDVRYYEWVWRFGMNYRFDWYTPVVAKY
jgi:outer membrane immunogenic protein